MHSTPIPKFKTDHKDKQVAPKIEIKIEEYELKVEDLESNRYTIKATELDTTKDIKLKLQANNAELIPDKVNLLYEGRALEDD